MSPEMTVNFLKFPKAFSFLTNGCQPLQSSIIYLNDDKVTGIEELALPVDGNADSFRMLHRIYSK